MHSFIYVGRILITSTFNDLSLYTKQTMTERVRNDLDYAIRYYGHPKPG